LVEFWKNKVKACHEQKHRQRHDPKVSAVRFKHASKVVQI
jgi:hypothetical protein